jgi:putative membrane protein insertion efficiency factor
MVSSVIGLTVGGRIAAPVPAASSANYNSHYASYPTHHHHSTAAASSRRRSVVPRGKNGPKAVATAVMFMAMNRLSTHYGTSILFNLPNYQMTYNEHADGNQNEEHNSQVSHSEDGKNSHEKDKAADKTDVVVKPITAGMVGAIGFYKNFISPLLPPACRFLPTCSQYGVQAIEEFGPQKGLILTAWRLLRCSPLGGRGYDPPRWPPVSYTFGSY